jgi:hypothetical protein
MGICDCSKDGYTLWAWIIPDRAGFPNSSKAGQLIRYNNARMVKLARELVEADKMLAAMYALFEVREIWGLCPPLRWGHDTNAGWLD